MGAKQSERSFDSELFQLNLETRSIAHEGCSENGANPGTMELGGAGFSSRSYLMHEQQDIGYDGGKKIKGRKRHQLVDTLGFLISVVVKAANVTDYDDSIEILSKLNNKRQKFPLLFLSLVDGGYHGKYFMEWVMNSYRWVLEVIKRGDDTKGLVLLPRRWVVERSFGWMMWNRR